MILANVYDIKLKLYQNIVQYAKPPSTLLIVTTTTVQLLELH